MKNENGWRWISREVVYAIHDMLLAQYGGPDGIRDAGLVDSALARPQNLCAYGNPDAAELAAAYAYGLARNHGFFDGNKRTAWVVARAFLADNDCAVEFDMLDSVSIMEKTAAGEITESELATWFRKRINHT